MTSYLLQPHIAAQWEGTPLDKLDFLIPAIFSLRTWQAGIKVVNGDIISLDDSCIHLLCHTGCTFVKHPINCFLIEHGAVESASELHTIRNQAKSQGQYLYKKSEDRTALFRPRAIRHTACWMKVPAALLL